MDFIPISKYIWLEAMVEETKQYSLCYRYIWLRTVLSVNWPEKAGLFFVQFGGTQLLPSSQMAKWDLVQEKLNIVAI